jgi:predicted PurR-regulated permease PerM
MILFFSILGIIAAGSLFLKTGLDPYRGTHRVKNNLYSMCCDQVSTRFRDFYRSFATVMGAQITISLINTVLTAIFLLAMGMPHALLLIAVTLLCGLVPIVGNLVSNTIIVFVALTVSLKLGIVALLFLVLIHKLEYFLNSKVIGDRIRNPILADIGRPDHWRTTYGYSRSDPCAGGIELFAGRNADSRRASSARKR